MRELFSDIEIDATPARAWEVLTDFAAYPDWNPFILSIKGRPVVGEKLEARIQPPGARAMTFRPTVLAAEPERELRWFGRLLLPRAFDGEHSFTIEPLGDARVRFVQAERFQGLLVPLFGKTLAQTEHGFADMNDALRRRTESAA